jgi:deoxycytidylate deaminase
MTRFAEMAADCSIHPTHQVGCAIFVQGKLIALGTNNKRTHPEQRRFGKQVSCHAEFLAIKKLKNKNLLNGSTLVVCRKLKDGSLAQSRPCELCMPLLLANGVKRIMYSTAEGYKEERL